MRLWLFLLRGVCVAVSAASIKSDVCAFARNGEWECDLYYIMHILLSAKCNSHIPRELDCGDDTGTVVNAQGDDVSYSTRHVEESWHHLMKSEDTAKFKQIAVCNFDFLLAAVSGNLC